MEFIFYFVFTSVGEDFEDAEEDDNMDEMEQPDDDAQIELLQQGEGTGQLQMKRITTPYMTKYTYCRSFSRKFE